MEEPCYMDETCFCEICGMPIRETLKKERDYFKDEEGKLGLTPSWRLCFYTIVIMPDMCIACRMMLYDQMKKFTEKRKKQVEELTIKSFQ